MNDTPDEPTVEPTPPPESAPEPVAPPFDPNAPPLRIMEAPPAEESEGLDVIEESSP